MQILRKAFAIAIFCCVSMPFTAHGSQHGAALAAAGLPVADCRNYAAEEMHAVSLPEIPVSCADVDSTNILSVPGSVSAMEFFPDGIVAGAEDSSDVQTVGLVLSGGGAKGLSHIGVIKALEENNIPIDYICGTSMGSIIGGLYAIGVTPDEMMALFNSEEFAAWYKGIPEAKYDYPLLKPEPKPEFVSVTFSRKDDKKGIKLDLPTSLVRPYPMDLAFVEIFAAANAAAKRDFDSLMIPFFCVSADIVRKKEYIAKSGDLGSAIRASMTYPFYFKPIVIDSTLLFDGGFYNNFPWEEMDETYSPDILIGSKCVRGEYRMPKDDDIVAQIETMIMTSTEYSIPEDKGVVIHDIYDYGLMDFDKVNEIAEQGYRAALKYIPELKKRIKRRESARQLEEKRLEFRKKWIALWFDEVNIAGSGDVSEGQKEQIEKVIRGGKKDSAFSFFDLKEGYYKLVAIKGLKTIYPSAEMKADSLYRLNLRVSTASPFKLSIGGNISSSILNQGYIGLSYSRFGRHSWSAAGDFHIGRFYNGGDISFRHNFSIDPLAYYELKVVAHQYNYSQASEGFFFTSEIKNVIKETEVFFSGSVATPVSRNSDMLAKFNISGGSTRYGYFTAENYSNYDEADITRLKFFSPSFIIEKNTTDYVMYPTSGVRQSFSVKYIYGKGEHAAGTTSDPEFAAPKSVMHDLRLRFTYERYFNINDWFSLGFHADAAFGPEMDFGNYKSSLMYRPGFRPFPHAQTMLLENYRAATYAGLTVNPVFKLRPFLYLHVSAGYFQPYKRLIEQSGGSYIYSGIFPRGGFIGNAAAVWQSPIGPISLSLSYYEQSEVKWFPQFNIGFLLFEKSFLSN